MPVAAPTASPAPPQPAAPPSVPDPLAAPNQSEVVEQPKDKKKTKGKQKSVTKPPPQLRVENPSQASFFLLLDFLIFGGSIALCVLIFLNS